LPASEPSKITTFFEKITKTILSLEKSKTNEILILIIPGFFVVVTVDDFLKQKKSKSKWT
jgi:hypothetical protein